MFSMADNLDDGEFWLPSQFLTDDDKENMERKRVFRQSWKANTADSLSVHGFDTDVSSSALFSSELSYGFSGVSSDLNSPVESLVGSTETESEEEDPLAELTRRMAHSTIDVDFDNSDFVYGYDKYKCKVVSSSPQSTLCPFGSECGCSHGSPNSVCQVPSPRATWDLLHAAAGEVERMRLNGEAYCAHHGRGLLGPPRKPSPVTLPAKDIADFGLYPNNPSLSNQQLMVAKLHMLKQQQMLRQQGSAWGGRSKLSSVRQQQQQQQQRQVCQMVQNRGGRLNEIVGGSCTSGTMGLSSSTWPPLQQAQQNSYRPNGSGMRALFLGNPGGKKECAGTGVFLPRRVDVPAEPRRKPACSTVLVPAKVMQALNLNMNDMVAAQPQLGSRFNGGLGTDVAVKLRLRNNNVSSQHTRNNLRPPQQLQQPLNPEIRLPQEWTY